jgi:hypothetical protein
MRVSVNVARMDAETMAQLLERTDGGAALAAAVREHDISPMLLLQAVVDPSAVPLLDEWKAPLCHALGLPKLPHRAYETPAVAAAGGGPRTAHLLPASALAGARLRVALGNAQPHFLRGADGHVQCNRCAARLPVRTDDELVALVHRPTWKQLHWKTFLCAACTRRADCTQDADMSMCRSCHGATATEWHELRYACADNDARARVLPLCATCARANAMQLATVAYDPV